MKYWGLKELQPTTPANLKSTDWTLYQLPVLHSGPLILKITTANIPKIP